MRKTYYSGDIVAVLNVGNHYQVYNFELETDYEYKNSIYNSHSLKELNPSVQGQLYYVGHIEHDRGYILLKFGVGHYYTFLPSQVILYKRPIRNHIKALAQWLKYNFLINKPLQQ